MKASIERPSVHLEFRDSLTRPYYLDPASVAVASLLPLRVHRIDDEPTEVVDLCAAPGGKSLVLAMRLSRLYYGLNQRRSGAGPGQSADPGPSAGPGQSADPGPPAGPGQSADSDPGMPVEPFRLVANEKSSSRRRRLVRVLDTHLPKALRSSVSVYGHDATRWGVHRPASAAAVLADVPCSTEGHVLQNPLELSRWSPSRIRRNVLLQHAILAAAIDTVKPGGHVLYSTCALTPEENDDVVSWALARRAGLMEVVLPGNLPTYSFPEDEVPTDLRQSAVSVLVAAERTGHGLQILPDRAAGAGPMYVALLRCINIPVS